MPGSTVCLTFDFDALSAWLAYDNVTPAMLHRGEYGARVGVPRVLGFLERERLPATFFVPGHTAESFPRETEAIIEHGHEIAHHSYAHIDPSTQTWLSVNEGFARMLGYPVADWLQDDRHYGRQFELKRRCTRSAVLPSMTAFKKSVSRATAP